MKLENFNSFNKNKEKKLEFYNPINEYKEEKAKKLISKDFFSFQFEFAQELYRQAQKKDPNVNFVNIVINFTPELRAHVVEYIKEKDSFEDHFKDGITEKNLLEKAYDTYVSEEEIEVQETPDGPNQKFGPLFYLTTEDEGEGALENNITFHFSNDLSLSPRQLLNIEERKKDIHDMLKDIREQHPNTKTLSTASWLLDAIPEKIMQELFPQTFINSMKVKEAKIGWRLGTMIWGQFLDAEGNLKKSLADELMKNLRNRTEDEYLIDLLKPPLHKPKSGIAPIEDFYKMYSV